MPAPTHKACTCVLHHVLSRQAQGLIHVKCHTTPLTALWYALTLDGTSFVVACLSESGASTMVRMSSHFVLLHTAKTDAPLGPTLQGWLVYAGACGRWRTAVSRVPGHMRVQLISAHDHECTVTHTLSPEVFDGHARETLLTPPVHDVMHRSVGLLKVNVERAEEDVLAGIQPKHWGCIRQVSDTSGFFSGYGTLRVSEL